MELLEVITDLVNYRRQIEQLTIVAWRSVEIQKKQSASVFFPPVMLLNLEQCVSGWEKRFAEIVEKFLLNTQRGGDEILPLLRRQHEKVFDADGDSCPVCGTFVRVEWYESTYCHEIRLSVSCPLCGPLSDHRFGGPSIHLKMPEKAKPGSRVKLEIELIKSEIHFNIPNRLIIDLIDKSRPGSVYRKSMFIEGDEKTFILEIPIAENAGLDVHFVRVIWIFELEIAYVRRSFVIYPA